MSITWTPCQPHGKKADHAGDHETRTKEEELAMAMHEWADVERDLFPAGDEDEVSELEGELRAQVRAYKLAEIRRARHLTQQQVAAALGVSKARVSQIEHGQADRTAIQGLAGYVAALGGRLELVADFGDERLIIG